MLERLKREVCETGIALFSDGRALNSLGCVSAFDPESGLVVIKAENAAYASLRPIDMSVVDLKGYLIEGSSRPAPSVHTHIEIYKAFPHIRSILHTHMMWTSIWAQSGREIPVYGTAHANIFNGPIPCTRKLDFFEISEHYDENVGKVIVDVFKNRSVKDIPAVLLRSHGGYVFADSSHNAMLTAQALEDIAQMAYFTEALGNTTPVDRNLSERHFYSNHDI